MAMHIHTSASEQSGSVEAHLYEAALNAVDVCWFTDHDGRMDARDYRKTRCISPASHMSTRHRVRAARGRGRCRNPAHCSAARSGGGIVTSRAPRMTRSQGGALMFTPQSTGTAAASYGFWANSKPGGWSYPTT